MPLLLTPVEPAIFFGRALRVLWAGGVVSFPTETVYGLAAWVSRREGVEKIFSLKGRCDEKPLPLQFHSLAAARDYGFSFSDGALRAAEKFWPGPLTIVLGRPPKLPEWFSPGAGSIAVRVPNHPIALALLSAAGGPLAVTSANRSGEPPATDAPAVLSAFKVDKEMVILDGGAAGGGISSTVIDGTSGRPHLLREGPVGLAEIELAWGGD